ncbi:DUF2007 domain-containing protein [bacterium]|nr:DUF2007 domain-containing protein [bacterium]
MNFNNEPRDSDDLDLVVVYTTTDQVTAALAGSCLEGEQIPFMVRHEGLQSTLGIPSFGSFNPAIVPLELLVPAKYAEEAIKVLQVWEQSREPEPGAAADENKTPPMRVKKIVFAICMMMVGFNIAAGAFYPGSLLIVVPVTGLLLLSLPGYLYWNHLHRLGYEWPTISDAHRIRWCCAKHAYELPPASEVETLPGIERNSESIIQFLINIDEYKRGARKKDSGE